MRFQMNKNRWRVRGALAVASLLLLATSVLAEDSSFTYPIKRHVTGNVMSVSMPAEKGRDGEITVNERIYRVSPGTVMVDQNEKRTRLDYFKAGSKVYMIVDIYAQYNEALFISPREGND